MFNTDAPKVSVIQTKANYHTVHLSLPIAHTSRSLSLHSSAASRRPFINNEQYVPDKNTHVVYELWFIALSMDARATESSRFDLICLNHLLQ
jgi:hypothetical protein